MERQLRLYGTDLLAVAERRDRYGAIHVPKLRRFQQRERRNTLARSQLKSVRNQRIVFIAANLDFVSVTFAVIRKLSFYVGFSDQSI